MKYLAPTLNALIMLWILPHLKWVGPKWFDGDGFLIVAWWLNLALVVLGVLLYAGSALGFEAKERRP